MINPTIISGIFFVGFVGVMLALRERSLHREKAIDLRLKAEKAKTLDELNQVWNELADSGLMMTSAGSDVRSYLQGRLDGLRN